MYYPPAGRKMKSKRNTKTSRKRSKHMSKNMSRTWNSVEEQEYEGTNRNWNRREHTDN